MQNQRLTFAQLQQEFEEIPQITLRSIKGGESLPSEVEWVRSTE